MPYGIAESCARYGVYYYPIVSSGRAFRALWKRAYHKFHEWLGGVVYEDPWLAGGHNGITNSEDPTRPEPAYPRVRELRSLMLEFGLAPPPILMPGRGRPPRQRAPCFQHPPPPPPPFPLPPPP